MAPTEAQKRAIKAYRQKRTKQIVIDVKIEDYDALGEYCESRGIAKATFIRQAIKEKMEREPVNLETNPSS